MEVIRFVEKVITRRDFLKAGSCLAMAGLMGFPFEEKTWASEGEKSRVVLIRDKDVLDGAGRIRPEILGDMLDRGMASLTETDEPGLAWKRLFGPEDAVGIKSNVWPPLPTPGALEEAIRSGLARAGVKDVSVTDRGVLTDPVFKRATALVNARPMRTHHWSGLGTLIKNYIMFVPDPWKYHDNACEKLGSIWVMPHVKGKTRLNILVMLTPLFYGVGPHSFNREYTWPYCGLILSRDPVAADATGGRIMQAKRDQYFREKTPIRPALIHIAAADTQYSLGNSSVEKIDLIRLGWQDEALI